MKKLNEARDSANETMSLGIFHEIIEENTASYSETMLGYHIARRIM
jgi:hypothetical protein